MRTTRTRLWLTSLAACLDAIKPLQLYSTTILLCWDTFFTLVLVDGVPLCVSKSPSCMPDCLLAPSMCVVENSLVSYGAYFFSLLFVHIDQDIKLYNETAYPITSCQMSPSAMFYRNAVNYQLHWMWLQSIGLCFQKNSSGPSSFGLSPHVFSLELKTWVTMRISYPVTLFRRFMEEFEEMRYPSNTIFFYPSRGAIPPFLSPPNPSIQT